MKVGEGRENAESPVKWVTASRQAHIHIYSHFYQFIPEILALRQYCTSTAVSPVERS